ncbi:hypothetical protein ACFP51_06535 [Streptomyces pratens]|uniref:Uncharacterized protein n=1 Tax=Streptomyces pratens TaxID=887456 RepID=A0ABW1M696_9ACTN
MVNNVNTQQIRSTSVNSEAIEARGGTYGALSFSNIPAGGAIAAATVTCLAPDGNRRSYTNSQSVTRPADPASTSRVINFA